MAHDESSKKDERPRKDERSKDDRSLANASGLPLQVEVARVVRDMRQDDRWAAEWRVEAEEIPVGDGFLDMLLMRVPSDRLLLRIAVEVKRYVEPDEQRPLRLLFLTREPNRLRYEAFVPYFGGADRSMHAGRSRFEPTSVVASYCIFGGRRGNENMDSIARELLAAIDQLSACNVSVGTPCMFLPMLVTNAELRVLELSEADLETGRMNGGQADGATVPWVRYTKTLSQNVALDGHQGVAGNYNEWSETRVRTVMVVTAKHLERFLREFDFRSPPWEDAPRGLG